MFIKVAFDAFCGNLHPPVEAITVNAQDVRYYTVHCYTAGCVGLQKGERGGPVICSHSAMS